MPRRRGVGCGLVRDRSDLLRFVARDALLIMDRKDVLQGRGAYLCPDKNCFASARKRKGSFSRALKAVVDIPEEEEFLEWLGSRA